MDTKSQRVLEVFRSVLELDPEERDRYLTERYSGDADLRRSVLRLLELERESRGFLSGTGRPERIGPYRILDELGKGGMGVVYLAEMEEPVRRTVALKATQPGAISRDSLRRFQVERQALVLMSHPNIAVVYDPGLTADGRPYYVMEYVRGVAITEYCDKNRLRLRAR